MTDENSQPEDVSLVEPSQLTISEAETSTANIVLANQAVIEPTPSESTQAPQTEKPEAVVQDQAANQREEKEPEQEKETKENQEEEASIQPVVLEEATIPTATPPPETVVTTNDTVQEASQKEVTEGTTKTETTQATMNEQWMKNNRVEVYTCPTIENNPHSVLKLREYFSGLDEAAKRSSMPEEFQNSDGRVCVTRKLSYTLPDNRLTVSSRQPNRTRLIHTEVTKSYTDLDEAEETQNRPTTSVEELRQIFEHEEEPVRIIQPKKYSGRTYAIYDKPSYPLPPTTSKSVEFYSRPPKFRTPSPKEYNLPTPPPLPLPNDTTRIRNQTDHFESIPNAIESGARTHSRSVSQNFVTDLDQTVQPIASTGLPFRSRSLAIDRSREWSEYGNTGQRPRAGSITQRSVSPSAFYAVDRTQHRSRLKNRQASRAVTRAQQRSRVCSNRSKGCTDSLGCQPAETRPSQTLIRPVNHAQDRTTPTADDEFIQLGKNGEDGVYVRSAVVYERLPDKRETEDPKQFVTTYVISQSPSPSPATIQATNLWVAEQAVQKTSAPIKTPTRPRSIACDNKEPYNLAETSLNRFNKNDVTSHQIEPLNQDLYQTDRQNETAKPYVQGRTQFHNPSNHSAFKSFQPNNATPSRPVQSASSTRRPAPRNYTYQYNRPYRYSPSSITLMDKAVQCNRVPVNQSEREWVPTTRGSWSVRSLSPPPPHRTPWLSSLSPAKNRSQSLNRAYRLKQSRSASFDHQTSVRYPSRRPVSCIPRTRGGVRRSYHTSPEYQRYINRERARKRELEERRQWIQRAESLSQERQEFHRMRGSWSPPYMRSPARQTPNDLEEPTEREIQDRVRQYRPLFLPAPPNKHNSSEIPRSQIVRVVDEGVQSENVNRMIQTGFDCGDDGGCIDTTPITEDFDAKRAYFEELIKTNRLLARCSFSSDCFHCPTGQTPHHSAYSSWDSDLHNVQCAPTETAVQSYVTRVEPARVPSPEHYEQELYNRRNRAYANCSYYNEASPDCDCKPQAYRRNQVNEIREPVSCGPQQYSSSLFMTSEQPNVRASNQNFYNTNVYNGNPMDRDYYARPECGLPKVAPDPSRSEHMYVNVGANDIRWRGSNRPDYLSPTHAELIHSPIVTDSRRRTNPLSTHGIRSSVLVNNRLPPRRSRNSDMKMDYAENSPYNQASRITDNQVYRGRVRQIVNELNEQIRPDDYDLMNTDYNHNVSSVPDLRRPWRYT
ncbi:unnamed protein product [Calicophoron daubneyi]|uniref:Uncharacterized protein n=1 Tax=Calicophoron daubneyi TaxID=300641 RepID=A0AAV2T307_CALDB